MLVNEIKEYKVNIQGRKEPLVLRLDFEALIKMHKIYGNAFLLIYDFTANSNLENLPKLMCCMAKEEISEQEIKDKLLVNFSTIDTLASIVNNLIGAELIQESEFEVISEEKKEQVKVK